VFRERRVRRAGDGAEGVDGLVEALGRDFDVRELALGVGEAVDELGDLNLNKGDIEFEMDLIRGDR